MRRSGVRVSLPAPLITSLPANSKVKSVTDNDTGKIVTAENLNLTGVVTMEAVHEVISNALTALLT